MNKLKTVVALFPVTWQWELKRIYYRRQIKKGNFKISEPEYYKLQELIKTGDWVIDIGANVGHYTKRFSELVGPDGRVIAFEPVPATFSLLAANVQLFAYSNVTLINAAVSDKLHIVGMTIPHFSNGMNNYYQAHISTVKDNPLSVLAIPLDSLYTDHRISLVKIDTEGHESSVIAGMYNLLKKNHPILIVETDSKKIVEDLELSGYMSIKIDNSPNIIFKPL